MKIYISAIFLILCSFGLAARETKLITLKKETAKTSLKNYYINSVLDSIPVDTTLGAGVLGHLTSGGQVVADIRLVDGVVGSMRSYMQSGIAASPTANPINISIDQLSVQVQKTKKGFTAKMAFTFSFYTGQLKLVSMTSTGTAGSNIFPAKEIGKVVGQVLKSSLKQFDKWWDVHKDSVVLDSVAITDVVVRTTTDIPDCIAFTPNLKLTYDDFQGSVPDSTGNEAAVTSSGISYETSSQIRHSRLLLHFVLTPAFNKKNSWFKPEGKQPQVLAHEQTHFDITAVKACEWAAAIRATIFTRDNFMDQVHKLQDQFTEACKTEEDTYDQETNHGLITEKQHAWEEKVHQRLKEVGCW